MTNTNQPVILDFALLEGREPGTEEYGQANLAMIMNFALDTIREITRYTAMAHLNGKRE